MQIIQISIIYLLAINLITFVVYGIDKSKAKKGKWRIPEATLLLLAALGGGFGALFAMSFFRHKTKHLKFTIGVPVIILIQLAILWYLLHS